MDGRLSDHVEISAAIWAGHVSNVAASGERRPSPSAGRNSKNPRCAVGAESVLASENPTGGGSGQSTAGRAASGRVRGRTCAGVPDMEAWPGTLEESHHDQNAGRQSSVWAEFACRAAQSYIPHLCRHAYPPLAPSSLRAPTPCTKNRRCPRLPGGTACPRSLSSSRASIFSFISAPPSNSISFSCGTALFSDGQRRC